MQVSCVIKWKKNKNSKNIFYEKYSQRSNIIYNYKKNIEHEKFTWLIS